MKAQQCAFVCDSQNFELREIKTKWLMKMMAGVNTRAVGVPLPAITIIAAIIAATRRTRTWSRLHAIAAMTAVR